jgi:hypothetical protein
VSREFGVMAAELTAWRDAFLAAGDTTLFLEIAIPGQ